MKKNRTKQLVSWRLIYKNLCVEFPVALLYVVESKGSSPGRKGFFMAVDVAGKTTGTIGGGIMEHKFIELAREKLVRGDLTVLCKRQVHEKSAAKEQSGMICSGEQTIFVCILTGKDKHTVEAIVACLTGFRQGYLNFLPSGIIFTLENKTDDAGVNLSEQRFNFQDIIGFNDHVYIVGGGHCSLALSQLLSKLNFYIHLYEERQDLPTVLKNKWAHDKTFLPDYGGIANLIPQNSNSYVVVMTEGYRTDEVVLTALLQKRFRYLGVLGSKAKIKKMFETYRISGISQTILSKIHAPIGLNIHSKTPEEIAVSISAALIAERNSPDPVPG